MTAPAPGALPTPGWIRGAARVDDWPQRAGSGDRDPLAAFCDATSTRVYGLAIRMGLEPGRAERVTRDAFEAR